MPVDRSNSVVRRDDRPARVAPVNLEVPNRRFAFPDCRLILLSWTSLVSFRGHNWKPRPTLDLGNRPQICRQIDALAQSSSAGPGTLVPRSPLRKFHPRKVPNEPMTSNSWIQAATKFNLILTAPHDSFYFLASDGKLRNGADSPLDKRIGKP